jgi:hypothetical protein
MSPVTRLATRWVISVVGVVRVRLAQASKKKAQGLRVLTRQVEPKFLLLPLAVFELQDVAVRHVRSPLY